MNKQRRLIFLKQFVKAETEDKNDQQRNILEIYSAEWNNLRHWIALCLTVDNFVLKAIYRQDSVSSYAFQIFLEERFT